MDALAAAALSYEYDEGPKLVSFFQELYNRSPGYSFLISLQLPNSTRIPFEGTFRASNAHISKLRQEDSS